YTLSNEMVDAMVEGETALASGHPAAARAGLAKALRLAGAGPTPEAIELENTYGLACYQTGDTAEARQAWQKALSLDPYHRGALLNLAAVLAGHGDFAGARALTLRVLEHAPDDPMALYYLARIERSLGNDAGADRAWSLLASSQPGFADSVAKRSGAPSGAHEGRGGRPLKRKRHPPPGPAPARERAPSGAHPGVIAWRILSGAAVLLAVVQAVRRIWWCDDAFISYRYAENLNAGLGLVYNAGERVEGYSNFLWTLWIALGMRLGVSPEAWSAAWGIAFYAASVALLAWLGWREARGHGSAWLAVPLAAWLAAAHRDLSLFATSGLETALFVFLALLAYGIAIEPGLAGRGAAACGLVAGLAALTRPEGALFAPVL